MASEISQSELKTLAHVASSYGVHVGDPVPVILNRPSDSSSKGQPKNHKTPNTNRGSLPHTHSRGTHLSRRPSVCHKLRSGDILLAQPLRCLASPPNNTIAYLSPLVLAPIGIKHAVVVTAERRGTRIVYVDQTSTATGHGSREIRDGPNGVV